MECLLIGPCNSGKTSLLHRLKWLSRKASCQNVERGNGIDEAGTGLLPLPATLPTIGTNIETLIFPKPSEGASPSTVQLREKGGGMAPVWDTYYSDAACFLYVIDASDPHRLSASTVLLLEVLGHPKMQGKQGAIVFNKKDIKGALTFSDISAVMRLGDILHTSSSNLSVFHTSAATCDGVDEVLQWIESAVR